MRLFMTGQSYSTKNSWDQYEFRLVISCAISDNECGGTVTKSSTCAIMAKSEKMNGGA